MFDGAAAETVRGLQAAGRIPSGDAAQAALLTELQKLHDPFKETVADAALEAANQGGKDVTDELVRQGVQAKFDQVDHVTSGYIRATSFEASESTLERMTGDVKTNLADSYEQGLGIDEAAQRLEAEFEGMKEHELERVARTEINSSQNHMRHVQMEQHVDFEQWWGGDDDRSRVPPESAADHTAGPPGMHGQITRVKDGFSNGLKYPGDRGGPIEEWINCRCRSVPFIMPQGYGPPTGSSWFYESELEIIEEDEVDEEELEMKNFYEDLEVDPETVKEHLGEQKARELMRDMQAMNERQKGNFKQCRQTLKGKLENIKRLKRSDETESIWRETLKESYSAAFQGMPNPKAAREASRAAMGQWTGSSNSPGGLSMSRALERLGLTKGNTVKNLTDRNIMNQAGIDRQIGEFTRFYGVTPAQMDEIVMREYLRTQNMLKQQGINKTVKVYRGQTGRATVRVEGREMNVFQPKGLDSFSTNFDEASGFGDFMLEAKVRRSRIFAAESTNNSFYEEEVLWLYHKARFSEVVGKYERRMVLKKKGGVFLDFTMEAHLSALYAERRRLKRNELTEEERERVNQEVKERIAAGEEPHELMEEYGALYT